ncbi:uncharacterized protein LOC133196213 [Saccostrea echinata]|uniref:uncharacterized protein LOC133193309 n=1 Tax=Saccostrea echinata TaxID=191078 RepID=UPI002A7F59C8|nr:uncharacterized protein LOC133193309 [Saccostrea echinata]XP_061188111.1 uncharacterized protein LOC133196213 [Saccostrea echinata]
MAESTQKRQQAYAKFLFDKVKKGDITPEEMQTIRDFKVEFSKGVFFRAVPSSFAMYAVYRYRSKGGIVGLGKCIFCAVGGLFLGFAFTPTQKLWSQQLERHNITRQHVLGKIDMMQKKNLSEFNEMMEQDWEHIPADKIETPKIPKFVERMETKTDVENDTQTNQGSTFLFGASNQETDQLANEEEGLMEKRMKRNRRKMKEESNTSEGISNSGKRVNKYGDVIE